MYKAIRKRDKFKTTSLHFLNIEYSPVGNITHKWPPRVGCGAFLYTSITNNWQTTLIREVEEIKKNVYKVKTLNSEYIIEKLENPIKIKPYEIKKKNK